MTTVLRSEQCLCLDHSLALCVCMTVRVSLSPIILLHCRTRERERERVRRMCLCMYVCVCCAQGGRNYPFRGGKQVCMSGVVCMLRVFIHWYGLLVWLWVGCMCITCIYTLSEGESRYGCLSGYGWGCVHFYGFMSVRSAFLWRSLSPFSLSLT